MPLTFKVLDVLYESEFLLNYPLRLFPCLNDWHLLLKYVKNKPNPVSGSLVFNFRKAIYKLYENFLMYIYCPIAYFISSHKISTTVGRNRDCHDSWGYNDTFMTQFDLYAVFITVLDSHTK